jgi:GAF domain-containing protein/anti-anti-sigma regulatory factor
MAEAEIRTDNLQELKELLALRNREMSALESAVRVFGAMHHPGQDLYRSLTQQAVELLGVEMGVILLHDTEQNMLVGQTPTIGVPDQVVQGFCIPLDDESPILDFWDRDHALIIQDVSQDTMVQKLGLDDLARQLGVRAVLAVGLRHDGKLLGAILLCNKQDSAEFTDDDVRLLSIFAGQVAVALENARLLDQTQRHVAEMTSLNAMASALAQAIDLDGMLNMVLAEVRRVLDYDGCLITLATVDGKALRVQAAKGQAVKELLGIKYALEQGINAWIYREGKPTLVSDATTDPRRLHIEGRTDVIRAAVGAPLIADGQSIGTIYACRNDPNSFTEADMQFLSLTAMQVAAAVQRARLLDQAQRRAKEMESISNVGAAMASSLDVEHVLQIIYEQASQIMDTRAFFVALYDAAHEELHFELFYDHGQRLKSFVRPMADNQGLTAHVIRTRQPLLIRNMETEVEALAVDPLIIGEPSRSWLGVPIIAKDQLLGVISAQSYELYAFSARQMRLLSAIANQAGISLQNAQLYEAVQAAHQATAEQRDNLARVHQIVVSVQQTDELPAKLQLIADGIHQMGWGRVSVSLRDAGLNVTTLVCTGFTPEDEAALRANLLPGSEWKKRFSRQFDRFLIGRCYYLPWSDPWVREQVRGVLSHEPEIDENGWHPQDLLYVPLYGRAQQIVGIIGLDDPLDRSRPTAENLNIIEVFAQETALIIENALLLADMQLLNTDLQEMVSAQASLLQTVEDLASPVVPIVDGVIVLPLVGHLDGRRATQILQTLLSGVEEHRAKVVILDITGVPIIDTQVASYLMQSVRASRLLGAEAILVGIRPDVAQTLVTLGVHLGDVVTRSDLQSGFQFALDVVGRRLTAQAAKQVPGS